MTSFDSANHEVKKVQSDLREHRGYIDGCFDLCHAGHVNAVRQASLKVHTLVVGPNSDEEINRHKGPTIMTGDERAEVMKALRWGDIVAADTPYNASEALLDSLNCQYFLHGDDPMIVDGVNVNEYLTGIGRFIELRRTTGVSTTDLTGKIL